MCKNRVTLYVPRGYDYRPVEYRCGNTGPHGERVICDECADSRSKMEEIKRQEENIAADNAWAASAGWGEF